MRGGVRTHWQTRIEENEEARDPAIQDPQANEGDHGGIWTQTKQPGPGNVHTAYNMGPRRNDPTM